ncbi:LOG2 [Acrasis kona]|uniref:LOG2 n=1 Tax=Acrasis kona TaxID=1008807 RepID=A0AAW2YJT9_9EUKA
MNTPLSSNPVSPDIYNLVVFLVICVFIVWIYRLSKSSYSLALLAWVLRTNRFNIINIAHFERIDNIWGEGSIRSYIQALFGSNIRSPSLCLKRVNGQLHIHKNTLQINKIDGKNAISFQFDSLVDCQVQLFWGVSENAFNTKVLRAFKEEYEQSGGNVLREEDQPNQNVPMIPDTTELENRDDESLLTNRVDASNDTIINVNQTVDVNIDELITSDEYTLRSEPVDFESGSNIKYTTPSDDLIEDENLDAFFTSLPLTLRLPSNNEQSSQTTEQPTSEEDRVLVDDNNIQGDVRLPLLILLRSNSITRSRSNAAAFDDDIICTYLIANFTSTGPTTYNVKPIKQFIQTHNELYELQEVYGAGQQEEIECVICLSEDRQVTLLPCRHQCVCKTCFHHIDRCPVCRANIREYIQDGTEVRNEDAQDANNDQAMN